MRWKGRRQSTNVEDRRGRRGGIPMGRGGASIGCGGLVLILLFSFITGRSPLQLLEVIGGSQSTAPSPQAPAPGGPPANDELGNFAKVVLADTEETWSQIFAQALNADYQEPTMVLFNRSVRSACGFASSAMGPFYCPGDNKLYLDLSFFDQMSQRFGAPGDFAQAYVIAHEVAHHVQNLLGISDEVQAMRRRASQSESNALSVRLELQADCLAGVWGHYANRKGIIEPGDFEEGLRAAAAIGDDMMQRRATGYVQPESWTHGSSEQRMRWLRQGLQSGDADTCDTLRASRL